MSPCNPTSGKRRLEISKELPSENSSKEGTSLHPPVAVCSSLKPNIPVDLASTNKARPNLLSVNIANQNRKKYVNSLHYSQLSGLTPTSPFDINNTKCQENF